MYGLVPGLDAKVFAIYGHICLATTGSSHVARVLSDLTWFECTGSSQESKHMYFASKLSCLHHSLGLSSVALVQNLHTIKIRSSFITSTRGVASHPSKSFDDVRGSTKTASSPTPSSLLHNPRLSCFQLVRGTFLDGFWIVFGGQNGTFSGPGGLLERSWALLGGS